MYSYRVKYDRIKDDWLKYLKYKNDLRLGEPIPDHVVDEMSKKKYALKTYAQMKWCVGMYHVWKFQRNQLYPGSIKLDLEDVSTFTMDNIVSDVSRFILEIRKRNGDEFPPKSLKHIVLVLQMHFASLGFQYEFLDDPKFSKLTNCLDNKMKLNASKGLGRKKRQAEVLEPEEIRLLWEKRLLGDHSPQALLDTLLICGGIVFGLRAGQEHRSLRREGFDPQYEFVDVDNLECIHYTEDVSTKTNNGGLKHDNLDPKDGTCYPSKFKDRCLVQLTKLYYSKIPKTYKTPAFYLQPNSEKNVSKGAPWFRDSPVGRDSLGKVVKRLCNLAGIKGYHTNHSLRAGCATVLYNDPANIPEQVIAERTGHRSLAIRSYKRTKKPLKRKVSEILNHYAAGGSDNSSHDPEENTSNNCKLVPMKHSVLKALRDSQDNVKNVKLDLCISLKND